MIPRLKPAFGSAELRAAISLPTANDIDAFERAFARLAKQKHAVAFPYGRTALVAIIRALDLRGADIICPAYTCVVVAHAIVTSGNNPVFVDPDPKDFNMDLQLIDAAITGNTRAIMPTSLFGYPVSLDMLDHIRQRYSQLDLIQDCAHSFFCNWQGRPLQHEGLCAFYGLNISKILSSIFGGMVTTDNDDFAERLRQVRSELLRPAGIAKSISRLLYLLAVYFAFSRPAYGLVNRLERSGLLDRFVKYYDPGKIDMPRDYLQQLTPIEARVGAAQCLKYAAIVNHRRTLAAIYLNGLAAIPGLILPPWNEGSTFSHFVIRSDSAARLKAFALARGVQFGGIVDYYIPDMESYRGCVSHGSGNGRNLPGQVVNLPVHMGTKEADANRIIRLVKAFFESEN